MKKVKTTVLALASLLGCRRGITKALLVNEAASTTRSAQHWKRKTAMAIGKPELAEAPDESLEAAHDTHMQAMANEMVDDSPGADGAMTDNERKGDAAQLLANERRERATELLAEAVAAGRVQAAAKPMWEADFAADFNGTKARLANVKAPSDDPAIILANERREQATELLGAAISAGRIKPSDKPKWEAEFASDFRATKAKLANARDAVIKVDPKTKNVGGQNGAVLANENERREKVQVLVNEKEAKGLSYDAAFAAVMREHPEIFEAMEKPEAKK